MEGETKARNSEIVRDVCLRANKRGQADWDELGSDIGASQGDERFGETLRSINGYAPHWFDGKFKEHNDRVNDRPVDWHMLVAAMAPRSVYISTAEQDYRGDQNGSFLSGKFAEPAYTLFGEKGLGVDEQPPVETPVGDFIGYHKRKGGHGLNEYDWEQYLNFADRHFGRATGKN